MRSQRGFTLLEALIALAIALPLGFALLAILGAGLRGATAVASAAAGAEALTTVGERFEAEAHSAAALFTPATDVLGAPNCDANGTCREVDFFTRDASGAPRFWAYRYDAAAQILTRYAYDDRAANGPVNLRAYGGRLTGIRGFGAKRLRVSQLAIPALAGYAARDVEVPLGYAGVAGGNALVAVDVQSAEARLHRELAPRLSAGGFSIVVGSYAPDAGPTPVPPTSGVGATYRYFGFVVWEIGPCVNIKIVTVGCGLDGDDSGIRKEQDGSEVLPGGTLTAPPQSQIPLADVCAPSGGGNSNAVQLVASLDAGGAPYVPVADARTGVSEWWAASPVTYVAPHLPMQVVSPGKPSPLGMTLLYGPGYFYQASYWLSC